MEAALHQRLDLVVVSEFNRLSGRGVAVLCRHEFISGDFYLGLIRCRPDRGEGAEQHGNDEIRFGDPDCAKQGVGIDLVNHSTPDGLQGHRPPDEPLVMVTTFARSR